MIQVYATTLTSLMNDLRSLEAAAKTWGVSNPTKETEEHMGTLLNATVANCAWLNLRSAWKQLHTITDRVATGKCSNIEFAGLIAQLRTRIQEDLQDRVFFSIVETSTIERFFKPDPATDGTHLIPKRADEIFDAVIVERFGDCIDDLIEASKCYVAAVYTASIFHLMRVVEHGLKEVAKIAGITDPKPSWGSVLSKVDLYCFRTKYEELPPAVQPHQALLRDLSAEMHSIQYAWRNRVSHVEDKLIPTKPIDHDIATEIMTTVQAFMRSLADRLPPP
jgi:hypothetical protein